MAKKHTVYHSHFPHLHLVLFPLGAAVGLVLILMIISMWASTSTPNVSAFTP